MVTGDLPARSHIGIFGETAVLAPMISAFLDDEQQATADPVQRSPVDGRYPRLLRCRK